MNKINPSYQDFMKKLLWSISLISIASAITCVGCSYLNQKVGLENDNPIEEFVESVIEAKTGLKLDLTPED